jgi:sigma-B regulation protein RsbU (phosphoserine phosphatase)
MFGIDRVKETLATSSGDCKQMIENIQHEAIKFIGDADQSDDLTMLGIRYTPQGENDELSEQITLNCDLKQTRKLNDFMKAVTARIGIGNKQSRNLRLAVEEAVTNVMNYAYPIGQEGKVMIEVKSNQHSIKIVISDEGVAFDPTEVGTTDVTLSAEDRPIGGLGILLVREMVESVNYERTNGKNILTLRMNILPDNP